MRSRSPRRLAALLAAALSALTTVPASAQSTGTFTVDRLPMAGAPSDGFAVWRPEVAEKTRFFGQLGLGLAVNPLRVDNYVDEANKQKLIKGNPLTTQFITYADLGVEFLNRASVQVSFPFVAYQAGNPTNATVGSTPVLPQNPVDLKNVAAGDLRLEARVILFRTDDRLFKLGASAAVLFPTGNRFSFAGDGRVGASFGLAAELDFKAAFVTLNMAYRLRPTAVLNELLVSNEVLYALGAYVPLRKGTIRLGAEIFGGFGASPVKDKVFTVPTATTRGNVGDLDAAPLEWMLNGKMFLTAKRQMYVGLGAGSRLNGGFAPDFRAVAMFGGSFSITDTDPKSPGYRYVFEAGDTADRDKDGVPDAVDACPDEPGELDSDPDKIGCPRYIRRVKGSNEIEVLKRIEFEFDKSTILPESYPILDEVVSLLAASPSIKKMAIEGHTDNQGTAEYNQRLSDDRAKSVLAYLVKKGIDAGRLSATGYGLTRPRATNDTDEGRQQNRRVEFHITEQGR